MFVSMRISSVFRQYVIIIIGCVFNSDNGTNICGEKTRKYFMGGTVYLAAVFFPLVHGSTLVTANFSMLILGMEISWISPVLVKLRDANQTTLSRPITEDEGAWIASMAPLAGLPVMFITGFLIDQLGRKRCIILAIFPRLLMCVLCLSATEVWMLFLARGLCGISDVIILCVVPTYASEIASKEIRGALGTVTQVLSALGMLVMLSIGPFVSYLTMNIVFSAVIFALFIPQLFLPESPYFLYVKGYKEDSLKVLTSIRNSEEIARDEMKEYSLNSNVSIDKKDLLKDKTVLKTIGKVVFLAIGFQMIGYNAVSAYLQTIFESTNTSLRPEVASVVIGCIQLLACLCTIFLTDKYGRKPILTATLLGMALGLVGLGAFFNLTEDHVEISGALNFLPLLSLVLVIYCFNAGIGSIVWMLIAELFDGPSRAIGVSIGVFATTLFIFLTTNYFSAVVSSIGPAATYWMFSGNCIITCLFILYYIPETKGKTFSEIQQALGRKSKEQECQ